MKRDFKYYPKYIYWELSKYCNLKCKHCFAEAECNADTIAEKDKILFQIEKMIQIAPFSVRFGGGEPLMVPYIYELIKFCKSKDITTAITTNGTLINKISLMNLKNSGLDELTISVDGLKDNHNYLRGEGNYEKLIDIIKMIIAQNSLKISIAFTVTAINYDEINNFVESMISLGIKKFYFFRYCNNSNVKLLTLDSKQLFLAAKAIYDLSNKYKNIKFICEKLSFFWFLIDGSKKNIKENCNFLKNIMTIKYNGDVIVCAAVPKILGNIYDDEIDKIYNRIFMEKKEFLKCPDSCTKCDYRECCFGGCKSNSYYLNKKYLNMDMACYKDFLNN